MPQTLAPYLQNTPEPSPHRKRWTRAEYDFLVRSELLASERYELIEGELLSTMGQGRMHVITVTLLTAWLGVLFGALRIQSQMPIDVSTEDIPNNVPEPDAAVLLLPVTEYRDRNPGPADILLVAEVSEATLNFDLRTKAALSARAGISEYWVFDLPGRRLLMHREPREGRYEQINAYAEHEMVSALAAPDSAVRVADLLPTA